MVKEKPWHEDDDFWELFGKVMFRPEALAAAVDDVDKIVTLLEIRPVALVLDLCCGVGRHSLELSRRGFNVTGVDRTRKYLEQARELADKEGLTIEFIEDDMRSFCRPETYDVIINMETSFSYFEDPQEDRQVVVNAFRSLKPGGRFLVEMHGKETLARIFTENNWQEIDGIFCLQERKVTHNWSWMENRWILIDGDKRTEAKVTHRLYSATEIISLMTDCGFSDVGVYGNLEGSPYNQKASRMVVVARK